MARTKGNKLFKSQHISIDYSSKKMSGSESFRFISNLVGMLSMSKINIQRKMVTQTPLIMCLYSNDDDTAVFLFRNSGFGTLTDFCILQKLFFELGLLGTILS